MKVAVSSTGPDLDDLIDPRFSRCLYYVFIDMDSKQFKGVENVDSYSCVLRGTATGNLVAGERTDAVITGHIGRKAAKILLDAGVRIYTGASGKVNAAFEAFQAGRLEELTSVPRKRDS